MTNPEQRDQIKMTDQFQRRRFHTNPDPTTKPPLTDAEQREAVEDRMEIGGRVFVHEDDRWTEVDILGFRALESIPSMVTQEMLNFIRTLTAERDANEYALKKAAKDVVALTAERDAMLELVEAVEQMIEADDQSLRAIEAALYQKVKPAFAKLKEKVNHD